MSWFDAGQRDGFRSSSRTMDCDVVGGSFLDSKRAIVWRGEWGMDTATTDEDMCGILEAVGNVADD